jgi:UDP-2,3-diacylglucosamine pyrophosphatase LpxH
MNDKLVGRPLRLNKQTLNIRKSNYAELIVISDVHLGSPQCDEPRFKRMLDYCLQKKVYILLLGDMLETATRDSVGSGVYEQQSIAEKQYEEMLQYLTPLAKAGLVLGLHLGNHENRIFKSTGYNICKALARELGVPYLGDACWSLLKVGKQTYSLRTFHGISGARFEGTCLLSLERIAASFSGDAVICGHSHKCINSSVIVQYVSNGMVKEQKKFLIISGSFLKYGGYAECAGLPISKLGSPKLKLMSDIHDIHVSW